MQKFNFLLIFLFTILLISCNSEEYVGIEEKTPPNKPTNLAFTNTGADSVNLTWTKSDGATSYAACLINGVHIATFGDVSTGDLIGLADDTYNVVVRAVNANGESINSNTITFVIAETPPVIIDSDVSRIKMPDITSAIYNAVGTGFTCTGLAFDEVATDLRTDGKYVFWIGSDGRSDQDNIAIETFQGALVQVALDREEASNDYDAMPTLELLDEINLTTLSGWNTHASVQGIAIDKRGYLWATQFGTVLCINPTTKTLVGQTYNAEGFQGLAYDWTNDQMYVTDRLSEADTPIHLFDIDAVNGTLSLNTDAIFTIASPSVDIISMTKDDNQNIWASIGSVGAQYNLSGVQQQSVSVGGTNIQTEGLTVVTDRDDGEEFFFIISDAYYHHLNTPPDESLGDVNAIHKILL